MLRCFIILSILLTGVCCAIAQQKAFHGVIFQQGTPNRVAEASVRNLSSAYLVTSNNLGEFVIMAGPNDTLLITKQDYADYKIIASSEKPVLIQLIKIRQLAEVVVKAPSKKQEMEEVLAGYRKKGVYFNGKPPLLSYIFKPLTAIYELIGRDPQNARRFNNYYHRQMEDLEIDRRFNNELVKRITRLDNTDIRNFMVLYRPSYEKLVNWNEYDLMSYISRSFKAFNDAGRPAPVPLPSLTPPK